MFLYQLELKFDVLVDLWLLKLTLFLMKVWVFFPCL
jgi:hypothetical protein